MKKFTLILSILSIGVFQSIYAQGIPTQETIDIKTQGTRKAYYVLNADDKTVEIDNIIGAYDKDIADIDANQIESISVIKDQSAISKYGEDAKNGVIVINFKSYQSLSSGSKQLFEKFKKQKTD